MSKVDFIADMPADEYHSLDRLSASGIKRLLSGPRDYWYWTYGPGKDAASTAAMAAGTAKHLAGLEGLDAFRAHYEPPVSKDDYPGSLDKQDELKAWCKDHGLPVGGTKAALCDRITDVCEDVGISLPPLWMRITEQQQYAADKAGREILPLEMYNDALAKASQIAQIIDDLRGAGGLPEVTILFERGGIPCKARLDFVSPRGILDMKNVANKFGSPFGEVVNAEIAKRNMPIQAEWYLHALKEASKAKVLPFELDDNYRFSWLFLQSSGPSNIAIRHYVQHGISFDNGKKQRSFASGDARKRISVAMDLYAEYKKSHGNGREWAPQLDEQDMDDTMYPAWFIL